jgi:ferrous iron transport protein B
LLLFSQLYDLKIPIIVAFNMVEIAQKKGYYIDPERFTDRFHVPAIDINARTGSGIPELKKQIAQSVTPSAGDFFTPPADYEEAMAAVQKAVPRLDHPYLRYHFLIQKTHLTLENTEQ